MLKQFKAMATFMVAFLKLKELPIENGAINFSEEQKEALKKALGPKVSLEEVVTNMNKEIADMAASSAPELDQELKDLRKQAMEMLQSHGLAQEDAKEIISNPNATEDLSTKELLAGLIAHNKNMDQLIKKLVDDPEQDSPSTEGQIKKGKEMHSQTHFLGSNKEWDAFEGRNWNQRAAGLSNKPTDWASEGKVEIQKIKDDIDLYYRENPTEVQSLFRDLLGLPLFWNVRTKVDDQVADGNIISGEISQARKLPWLAKNKQLIQPEVSKIFPVSIDIEMQGHFLSQIETSWLNGYNKEGSQAYKLSFARFLLKELDKKARQEDRKVSINGVHVKTPDNATIPGSAINRGDGLLILLYRAYFYDKKFKIANIGMPTTSNILDYVKALIEKNLSEEDKNNDGKILYASPSWIRRYKERYRQVHGLETDFSSDDVMEIENYPNIKFYPLRDLEGSDFMFITDDNNIELMENIPGEKSMYRFESFKRNLFIFADYKWGPRFKHIGTKVKDTDPDAFKVQTVWCNMPPYIHDTYVPLYDDLSGEISLPYSNITFKDDWKTNITKITNTYVGQVIKVRGNTNVTGLVKNTQGLSLSGDFDLSSGGTLTLLAGENGDLTEIKRNTTPEQSTNENVLFDTETIDASTGSVFKFSGQTDITLNNILNGIENTQIITIYGGDNGNVTIDNVIDIIEMDSQAVLADSNDFVKLVKVDNVWYETERSITP